MNFATVQNMIDQDQFPILDSGHIGSTTSQKVRNCFFSEQQILWWWCEWDENKCNHADDRLIFKASKVVFKVVVCKDCQRMTPWHWSLFVPNFVTITAKKKTSLFDTHVFVFKPWRKMQSVQFGGQKKERVKEIANVKASWQTVAG